MKISSRPQQNSGWRVTAETAGKEDLTEESIYRVSPSCCHTNQQRERERERVFVLNIV